MPKEKIKILDPKHGSKNHLILPDNEAEPEIFCDSAILYEKATIREKRIIDVGPENTCAHCLRKALQRLHKN